MVSTHDHRFQVRHVLGCILPRLRVAARSRFLAGGGSISARVTYVRRSRCCVSRVSRRTLRSPLSAPRAEGVSFRVPFSRKIHIFI